MPPPTFEEACAHIRGQQEAFNKLLLCEDDVRPDWYLRQYGGLEWEALYRRVCEKLGLKPLK